MKVIKELEHGLLLNYFGIRDKFYLSISVLTFFSFDNPDIVLNEKEMWPFVQGELGNDAILDGGMPKPKGEVIIWGKCFAPEGKPIRALQASFTFGTFSKILAIFGDRFWKRKGGTLIITDPVPFIEMPIDYQHAFGGSGFDKNPIGKGYSPITLPDGEKLYPLPNIEDPKHLIGSPSDRPDPAGFGPIDQMWPQRAKKTGTYDARWLMERWPFYPDDMNWTFFNVAPEDQQIDKFFAGDESFSFTNMHKTKPLLKSRLPGFRHRVFVNQLIDFEKKNNEALFKEVKTQIDTVWFFPHAQRGIVISRGTVEVKDDEACDIAQVFIVTEKMSEQSEALEYYYEEFRRRVSRPLVPDMENKMEEANKQLKDAAEILKDLPVKINDAIAQGLGEAPRPVRTTGEVFSGASTLIDERLGDLKKAEERVMDLKTRLGHMFKIETGGFLDARNELLQAKKAFSGVVDTVNKVHKEKSEYLKDMEESAKKVFARIDPEILKKQDVDIETILKNIKEEPVNLWHEQGMRFVEECRERLINRHDLLSFFSGLGIRRYTLERSWIGLNENNVVFSRKAWGLKPDEKNPENPDEFIIPPGVIIPRFQGATLDKIIVRPFAEGGKNEPDVEGLKKIIFDNSRDILVEGSQDMALSFSPGEDKAFIRVADEMEALLLHQEIRDMCAIVAMKEPEVKLDKATSEFMKKSPQFLVVMYPETKNLVNNSIEPWKKVYPQAEPLILLEEKNLFEAKKAGLDLWQWIAEALRPEFIPDTVTKPKDVDVSKPGGLAELIPVIDVEAIINRVRKTLLDRIKPELDFLEAEKKKGLEIIKTKLGEMGIDIDEAMKKKPPPVMDAQNPYDAVKEEYKKQFAALKEQLKKRNVYKGEVKKKIEEMERLNNDILTQSANRYEEGMKKIEKLRAEAKAPTPDWAKKIMMDAKINLDEMPLKKLTRDDVVALYREGKPFERMNLEGVDLSGLDLRGINLEQANLQKANLKACILDNANLTQVIANEADFSKASLKGALMSRGIFQKGRFIGASLLEANLSQAVATEADFTDADLTGTRLEKALMEKTVLVGARLVRSVAQQAHFLSSDVSQADFSEADLTKTIFLKAKIDKTNFSKATIKGTIFLETAGNEVNFSGADMFNSRILGGSVIRNANFTDVMADTSTWMKSDLSEGDFRKCSIKRGLVEECDLRGANLTEATAKHARFAKSNLSDANMEGINLFQGSLRKAKLVRTNLKKSNLYNVEFYRTGVGDTIFEGANLKMTKLHKRIELLPEKNKDK